MKLYADPLVPAHPDADAQWRNESIQLANWGGFHGPHRLRFSSGSTLMSGASGTGKSTVLDAYIALMMPSNTPFNGASNDAGGRARSAEQRNLLTYLRGKMEDNRVDGSDEMRDLVLRGGNGEHIWGALAGTFINDGGRRFTVLRMYFVRAGARLNGDVVTSFATFDGAFDVRDLTPLAESRFDKRALRAAGLVPYGTLREFEDTIHARLSIGKRDGGARAMRLLARLQGGMEVQRVDTLYKSMVLEKPVTYEKADSALAHFADLEASYAKMLDETNKVKALERLPDLQDELAQAQAKALLIAQFGADHSGPSPFRLWRLRTERGLLEQAVIDNRSRHASVTATCKQAKSEEKLHSDRLAEIAKQKRANGGDAIDTLLRRIGELTDRQQKVQAAAATFQARTEAIRLVLPETAEEFQEARSQAAEFLPDHDDRDRQLKEQSESFREELYPLKTKSNQLLEERSSLKDRNGMVPHRLHAARVAMAQAAGLDPMADLPFAAELIDVLPEEEHWRKAVETTLGGIARTVLVDRRLRDQLSRAIDPISIRPRINFQAVDLARHDPERGHPDYVSGKLVFKDSPFSAWVQDRVTDPRVDHLCVATTADLDGREPRVTPAGQTRHGDRGAHGESGEGNVIGFSNERRLADIEVQLAALDAEIKTIRGQIDEIDRRRASLSAQRQAHVFVQDTSWEDIDLPGLVRQIEGLHEEIGRLRGNNSILDALQAEEERIGPLLKEANRVKVLSEKELADLANQHGDLVSEQDDVQDAVDGIENQQTATVTAEQQVYLDQLFASSWDTTSLSGFSANMRALTNRLRGEADRAKLDIDRATRSMQTMFEGYKQRWTEHNLGTTVDSAEGYREILDRIRSEGLHERRDRWRAEFARWSSDDLLRLNDAFEQALDDIEERLLPINRILKTLPFGGKGYLQINHRRQAGKQADDFRRELRKLSSGLAIEQTEAQVETRFKRLREFMAMIGIPEGHTKASTSQRDRYLDVRQHVVITAACYDADDHEVATYDSLVSKSGGEIQELVAFIVGAALRYQLGDEARDRPTFAPVFLDEGFIKSDSEFAGRAVTAWQSLGFQLIVGAPLDKVTALEPHMDALLAVTKNDNGYSFLSELVEAPGPGDDEEAAA